MSIVGQALTWGSESGSDRAGNLRERMATPDWRGGICRASARNTQRFWVSGCRREASLRSHVLLLTTGSLSKQALASSVAALSVIF